jgi:hypothetical protein
MTQHKSKAPTTPYRQAGEREVPRTLNYFSKTVVFAEPPQPTEKPGIPTVTEEARVKRITFTATILHRGPVPRWERFKNLVEHVVTGTEHIYENRS